MCTPPELHLGWRLAGVHSSQPSVLGCGRAVECGALEGVHTLSHALRLPLPLGPVET